MQDYPDYLEPFSEDESAETPNWVADAGTQLAQGGVPYVRYARESGDLPVDGQPEDNSSYRFSYRQGGQGYAHERVNWQQHTFYDGNVRNYGGSVRVFDHNVRVFDGYGPVPQEFYYQNQGSKPYEYRGHSDNLPDPRPLDQQFPRMGLPLPDAIPKDAVQPKAELPPVIREGNKVILPTFSMGDPDLTDKNAPKLVPYDANSLEAKLYIENRDSIVKITTEKLNSEGKPYEAYASGFFVTENGQIATANHVIDGARKLTVETADGRKYTAQVKQSHFGSESAVIELTGVKPGEKFRPIPLRDTASDLNPGEKLTVLGHPNGVEDIVISNGTFLSRDRYAATDFGHPHVNPNTMFIHASTRIQGGSSGGPILDSQGRAVGLTNFKHGDNSGGFVGIDDVRSLVNDPKIGKLSDNRSYFMPSSLQFDSDVGVKGLNTVASSLNLASMYLGRRLPNTAAATRGFTSAGVAVVAGVQMPGDYKAFKSSWQNGTTAEKVSSSIDLGSDGMMILGSAASLASRRFGVAGAIMATVGAGSKFGNAMLGDRRFH